MRNAADPTEVFPGVRWSAIFYGALVCLMLQLTLSLLGSGVGLSAIELEQGEGTRGGALAGAGLYAILTLFMSFFVGGWLAARLSASSTRRGGLLHGVGVFSLVVVGLTAFITSQGFSSFGGMLSSAGIGGGGAVTIGATLEQISEINPRIVSDVKLLDGKIVTQIVTDKQKGGLAEEIREAVQKQEQQYGLKSEVKEMAGEVRKATGKASLAAFGAILLGLLASALGGRFAARRVAEG